nr:hypothetical protein [Micromonospora sp. DSM 115978]
PPPTTDDARRTVDPSLLPLSLPSAAGRMERSDLARELLGDAAVEHVVGRARAEYDALRTRVPPHERARYFDHV